MSDWLKAQYKTVVHFSVGMWIGVTVLSLLGLAFIGYQLLKISNL